MTVLARALGLTDTDRAILVTADDLGLCHASTDGALQALASGAATSGGLVVPAPWAREAVALAAGRDVGVHLSLTARLPRYRWGPVTFAPSLLGGDGGFPATVADLHDHADPDEVRRECRSQLERAVLLGLDPTHLSVQDSALFGEAALFDVLADLADESGLPLRLPDPREASFGYPLHQLADERGVIHPDAVVRSESVDRDADRFVAGLAPGVTELVVRPATDTAELRALDPRAADRVADLAWLDTGRLEAALIASGARVLSWAVLRDAARDAVGPRT